MNFTIVLLGELIKMYLFGIQYAENYILHTILSML